MKNRFNCFSKILQISQVVVAHAKCCANEFPAIRRSLDVFYFTLRYFVFYIWKYNFVKTRVLRGIKWRRERIGDVVMVKLMIGLRTHRVLSEFILNMEVALYEQLFTVNVSDWGRNFFSSQQNYILLAIICTRNHNYLHCTYILVYWFNPVVGYLLHHSGVWIISVV